MNWTLVAVIGILVVFSVIGLKIGIVKMIWNLCFSIIGTVASVILTIKIGKISNDEYSAITYVSIFILIIVVGAIIGAILNRIAKLPVIRVANDLGGLVVGFCQGYIVISIAMFVVMILREQDAVQWIINDIENSAILKFLYKQNLWLFLAKKIF